MLQVTWAAAPGKVEGLATPADAEVVEPVTPRVEAKVAELTRVVTGRVEASVGQPEATVFGAEAEVIVAVAPAVAVVG